VDTERQCLVAIELSRVYPSNLSIKSLYHLRAIRAARELGVKTVAVYSEADYESRHVSLADQAVCIGPGPSKLSYLDQEAALSAPKITGADAIHPQGRSALRERAGRSRHQRQHHDRCLQGSR
jgi:acetyl/propionyl-CoA carboxylase alpha subunit